MANHKSAEKRIRQTVVRTEQNRIHSSRMKTAIRKVEEAIQSKKKDQAQEAFKLAQPLIVKVASKGIAHKRTVSRTLSRLVHRIKSLNS